MKTQGESGLPRGVRGGALLALAVSALCALAVLPAAASAEVPPPFWTKCTNGSAGGQCGIPRGVVVDPGPGPSEGHVYLSDQENHRINEFSAWGEFLRSWGWDVVASGPGDDTTAPEDEFEVCVAASGDVCKKGSEGGGRGQLVRPQGLALDPAGEDLYVVEGEFTGRRVQKFDLSNGEVEFELMFGGKVNKTKEEEAAPESQQNLCPIAPGDVCQQAILGAGQGQFGSWVPGSYLALSPAADTLYVGDQNRIHLFNPDGTFKGLLPDPEGLLAGATVKSVATDAAGDLYVSLESKPNVLKLSTAGAPLCTIVADNPGGVATAPDGTVYVIDEQVPAHPTEVRQYDSSCADKSEPFAATPIAFATGIATSTACNVQGTSIYLSSFELGGVNSRVRAFGERPDSEVCPPPVVPPEIDAQYATSVKADSAVVGAEINPHFWPDTTYLVEYGTAKCAESTCSQRPALALAGAGNSDEALATPGIVLTGLQPGTTYHYRFVSESGGGGPVTGEDRTFKTFPLPGALKSDCANQGFRGGASAFLPECRAFELVSPLEKNNGDVTTLARAIAPRYPTALEQSSLDGNKIAYSSATAFGDALSAPYTSQYIATRKDDVSWSTHAISPPRQSKSIAILGNTKLSLEYRAFSADLCQAWLQHDTDPILAPGAIEGFLNLYSRENCGAGADGYEALSTVEPPSTSPAAYRTELQGLSADGAHAFLIALDKLTEDAANIAGGQLYEASGGELHYVCILPNGTPSGKECTAGTLSSFPGGEGFENTVARAVSEDGSRVFWTSSLIFGPGPLYLRQNPAQEQSAIEAGECTEPDKACTIELSAVAARFWTAATDGSKAIFTVGDELRSFDVETEEATSIAKGTIGVAGASEDASRIYFASTEALSDEPNSEGNEAEAGKRNLYLYEEEEGEEGSFEFIAELSGEDVSGGGISPLTATISPLPVSRAVRVSSDGQILAFTSNASPTGYDNTDALSGKADSEVYLYEAEADELDCVSCNPSGARPHGQVVELDGETFPTWSAAQIPAWENQLYAPRALSEDGTHLFFESNDALVPRDSNGAQDVYEWQRADNESDCEKAGAELYVQSAGGCLSLISSGQSPIDSEFADASPDGRDVFIRTASSLVSWDPGLVDLYDARRGGGLPPPPPLLPPCDGASCQSPSTAPNDPTPASASFKGAGNPRKTRPLPRPHCPKGERKVRQGGKARCVKQKKRKAKTSQNHNRRAGQ